MKSFLSIPNQLTFLRMFLVPLFVTALIYRKWKLSFAVFLVAAATDAMDGFLARKLNQKTSLGKVIDPLADKVMMVSAFIALSELGVMPAWLTVVVVSRDALLVGGVIILKLFSIDGVEIEPSKVGKATTFFQVLAVSVSILSKIFEKKMKVVLLPVYVLTFSFTVLSGVQYFSRGLSSIYQDGGQNNIR